MAKNERPIGVTILAVLAWIGAVFAVISGITLAFNGSIMGFGGYGFGMMSGFGMASGIIEIVFGVFAFFVGKGLWDGENWARVTALVLCALGIIASLRSLISSIVPIIINGVIIWYLGFNAEAKRYFGAKGFFS